MNLRFTIYDLRAIGTEDGDCGIGNRRVFVGWEPRFFKGADPTPPRNLYDETSGELKAKLDLQPSMLAAESLYRPQYTSLDLADLQALLNGQPGGTKTEQYTEYEHVPAVYQNTPPQGGGRGPWTNVMVTPAYDRPVLRSRSVNTPAQRGLLDIYENDLQPASDRITANSLSNQRGSEIADVEALGPRATQAFRAANPEQAALMAELNRQAQGELGMGATLDPSLRREVQQSVRQGQAARGMGLGMNDLAEEGYFTAAQAEQLRQQRRTFASGVVGLNQGTSVDPFLATLGRPGVNLNQSNGLLGSGLSLNKSTGPQLFGSSVNANDVFNSNFNQANATRISNANNDAATQSAAIGGGAALAGSAVLAIAL